MAITKIFKNMLMDPGNMAAFQSAFSSYTDITEPSVANVSPYKFFSVEGDGIPAGDIEIDVIFYIDSGVVRLAWQYSQK